MEPPFNSELNGITPCELRRNFVSMWLYTLYYTEWNDKIMSIYKFMRYLIHLNTLSQVLR